MSALQVTFWQRAELMLDRSIPIIPLRPNSKVAFINEWQNACTTDVFQIAEWNEKDSTFNCAAVAKFQPGGFWFLDDDLGTLADTILTETGHSLREFPRWKTSRGFHYPFLHDGNSLMQRYGSKKNSGVIDVPGYKGEARCDDQYIVSPLSNHPSGAVYQIEKDAPIIPAPEWLLAWLKQKHEQSESRKPETAKAKSVRTQRVQKANGSIVFEQAPPDLGFKELFDRVGWKPLIDRMNKMSDARFHNVEIEPGLMTFCPMPGHQPRSADLPYTACFGATTRIPAVVHCFGCDFSGDLVKTVRAFDAGKDGGEIKHETMYDAARAICQQEGLDFNEFFPDGTPILEETAGSGATAGGTGSVTNVTPKADVLPLKVQEPDADPDDVSAIPAFDPSVINGIYAKFVELVTRGTTLEPQFAYTIAKTIVGIRMAGKVEFENLDVEPRFYAVLIGETGSGKGESFRRMRHIIQPDGAIGPEMSRLKVIDGFDSGAGLKDLFFEPPADLPVLCYIDEITTLGNKSKDTRNPAILDQLIELADSTSISRVLAKNRGSGGAKSKTDARLCTVMCGQDGEVFTKAFAGRTKLGLYDRFYPEFGTPQETGDLPKINPKDAFELLAELNKLDYSGTMTMSAEAKTMLEEFWRNQRDKVRRKARFKKNISLDAFMSAFGCGRRQVEASDMEIAVKIFKRQLVIRQVCFTMEAPDRVGYYLGLIKRVTERMIRQREAGIPDSKVARSRRDYEKVSNASRDNEEHIFERAWNVHRASHLMLVKIQKSNGQTYDKFLPLPEDPE